MKSREIHLIVRPDGPPKTSDFALVERAVASPSAGQVLVKNLYMSVDPAMRPPLTNGQTKLNEAMPGGAIGKIVESAIPEFKAGDYVQSRNGFREFFLSDGSNLERLELKGEALTTHLHVLGLTGLTAWGGLLIIGKLKEGETVFVSAAAGAVGSMVGQIAKIKSCKVIGSCGSEEKKNFLEKDLGFDCAFNYKGANIRKELQRCAPDGIDVYFDNVGGDHLDAALTVMKRWGRIPVCGMISTYNNRGARSTGVTTLSNIIYSQVTLRGFVATEFLPMRARFLEEARQWLAEGRLKYRETILDGIEKAPEALIGLFTGLNTGKMLVRLGEP
jgi:hypothetical protein